MKQLRHFLSLDDLDQSELLTVINRAIELKAMRDQGKQHTPLQNKILTMIFEHKSTRTRLSFEAGMLQLGGQAIYLNAADSQLSRGEPIADTARVISKMTDAIMIRAHQHEDVVALAEAATVPVINGLTDRYHPCQLLADLQTIQMCFGRIEGLIVAWLGDYNNMCRTYEEAAERLGFELRVCVPQAMLDDFSARDNVRWVDRIEEAVSGAHVVTTDVWASMGQEQEQAQRSTIFQPYQVGDEAMARAHDDAIFLHCLPAHRGEEVSASVIDGNASQVWLQAENRLHAQKALLEFLI